MGNAVVTGGAGFIGSHLVDRLLKDGHKVTIVDNFSTGRMANLKEASKASIIGISVADKELRYAIQNIDIDYVFHLAGLADIVPSIEKPLDYHEANVNGTLNLLEAIKKCKVKKFIYAASSSCYGIPNIYPTWEEAPCAPEYPYALTKYLAEQYVMAWGKYYSLPVISLRMFNVYGPRSRTSGAYGAVMGTFIAQKLHNLPFTRVGNGKQRRDFVYVSDVVEAYIKAAESNLSGEIINIGKGDPRSVNDLINIMGGPDAKIVDLPKRPGEPDQTWADIKKAKKLLGWKPKVSLEEGVNEILTNHIADYKDAPVWTQDTIKVATKEWFEQLGNKDK